MSTVTHDCFHMLVCLYSRSRFMSMSSDDYPYDTSECCSSSVPSTSASLTKSMEQKLNGQPRRSTRVTSEHLLRHSSDFHLGDSVLGQVNSSMKINLTLIHNVAIDWAWCQTDLALVICRLLYIMFFSELCPVTIHFDSDMIRCSACTIR